MKTNNKPTKSDKIRLKHTHTNPINIPWKSSTTHSKTHKIGPLGADQDLEEHTVKRLTWEAEAEGRARTDEPKVGTGEGWGRHWTYSMAIQPA
jgi:hypothetical protein